MNSPNLCCSRNVALDPPVTAGSVIRRSLYETFNRCRCCRCGYCVYAHRIRRWQQRKGQRAGSRNAAKRACPWHDRSFRLCPRPSQERNVHAWCVRLCARSSEAAAPCAGASDNPKHLWCRPQTWQNQCLDARRALGRFNREEGRLNRGGLLVQPTSADPHRETERE